MNKFYNTQLRSTVNVSSMRRSGKRRLASAVGAQFVTSTAHPGNTSFTTSWKSCWSWSKTKAAVIVVSSGQLSFQLIKRLSRKP